MSSITKYSSMGLDGDSGTVGQSKATNVTRGVEATLAGKFYDATMDVTTTLTTVPLGSITATEEYEIWLRNTAAVSATNVVKISVTDGTNTIDMGVIRPQQPWGPVCLKAQSGSQPSLKVQTDTGTATIEVKVFEAGVPPTV